jgi:hypothetical protein
MTTFEWRDRSIGQSNIWVGNGGTDQITTFDRIVQPCEKKHFIRNIIPLIPDSFGTLETIVIVNVLFALLWTVVLMKLQTILQRYLEISQDISPIWWFYVHCPHKPNNVITFGDCPDGMQIATLRPVWSTLDTFNSSIF